MTEKSYPWDDLTIGDATLAPYDSDVWTNVWDSLFGVLNTDYGVIANNHSAYSGNLVATNPSGTTVRLSTGIALVDGTLYTNDANVDLSTSGDGDYFLVLRKSWANQTVRATLLKSPTFPSTLDGTTWDLWIWQISVVGGVHTMYDHRYFINNELKIYARQGGNADEWGDSGSTTRRAFGARMVAGTATVTFGGTSYIASYPVTLQYGVSNSQLAMLGIISVTPHSAVASNIYHIESRGNDPEELTIDIKRTSIVDGAAVIIFSWLILFGDETVPGVPPPVEP